MPPKINRLTDWFADYDTGRVLHFRLEDDWLVVHHFGPTDAGVIDLRGFLVEPCTLSGPEAVMNRVQALADSWEIEPGPPLTSRRLRVSAAQGSSLAEARRLMPLIVSLIDRAPRIDVTPDLDLARLVVRYTQLLGDGRGARKKLSKEAGIGEAAIKSRLIKAEKQGLWITSTPGKPGAPSPLAYRLLEED